MKKEEMISTNGIMYKIKSFFKNLFKKKEKAIEAEETISEEKKAFEESIIVKKDEERERILELQKRFREGKLNPEDITEEDIDKLTELYNEQISELNKQIEEDTAVIEASTQNLTNAQDYTVSHTSVPYFVIGGIGLLLLLLILFRIVKVAKS